MNRAKNGVNRNAEGRGSFGLEDEERRRKRISFADPKWRRASRAASTPGLKACSLAAVGHKRPELIFSSIAFSVVSMREARRFSVAVGAV